MTIHCADLHIGNPKRTRRTQAGWQGFFPYYAGFPEVFASDVIRSARLNDHSLVIDPWNGSGTTTLAAAKLGIPSIGIDVNPVMAVVAQARTLAPSERDSLLPLGIELLKRLETYDGRVSQNEPLLDWFGPKTAAALRAIERSAREVLVGELSRGASGRLENISAIASTFYVALFAVARDIASSYRTSNPTWTKRHKSGARRASRPENRISEAFLGVLGEMTDALGAEDAAEKRARAVIRLADTTSLDGGGVKADFILSSPPYCTRLDYTAATRIEFAMLSPLVLIKEADLSQRMTGSIRVPQHTITPLAEWGDLCNRTLQQIKTHPSKASSGYYYKTHVDYYDKMYRSLSSLRSIMRECGTVVLVAQDSYYKDVHNDLPSILCEMASSHGLSLARREDFVTNTLAASHPHSKKYRDNFSATEAVLCFQRAVFG